MTKKTKMKRLLKQQMKPKIEETPPAKNEIKIDKINPFEIHINRSKHDVVGRHRKEDRGLPGIAKAKALKKREATLLQEYKTRDKSNVFVDRRIGENDPTLDPEKKIALRLAAVKVKHSNKKSMFNLLDEDDLLTHGGKALDEDNLDDRLAFSDEEDDKVLDAQFVKDRHFGGGFLTKRENDDDKPKTKKERIDEIIIESKKKKADAKKEKEEQYEAVEKLNANLKTFMEMMVGKVMTDEDKLEAQKTSQFRDYDSLVKELGFDRTGKAKTSTRLKSEEEIVKEEKEKLLTLEAERLRRMNGETEPVKQNSRSADDLDDGFSYAKDDRFHLSYKDGVILQEESDNDDKNDENSDDDDSEEKSEDGDDGDSEDEMEAGDDLDDNSDQYSDIFDEDSDDEEVSDTPIKENKSKDSKISDKVKETMEAAKKQIPFTFEVPQEYEAFWAVLENRSPKEVDIILERMIKCNHPSLGGTNKEKMIDMCNYLLQTLNVVTEVDGDTPLKGIAPMTYVDYLIPHIYSVTQTCATDVASSFRQVLEEKYEDCSKFGFRRYPTADCYVFLKVAGILFPPSDYVHPVMSPVITFLMQLLGQAKVNTRRDVVAALFTSYLLFEYISMSKRYIPELINALNGLLFLCVSKEKQKLPLNPPFKRYGDSSELLVLRKKCEKVTIQKLTLSAINEKDGPLTDGFKVTVLIRTVNLLQQLCNCWSEIPSILEIMEPSAKLIQALSLDHYPKDCKETITTLMNTITALSGPRQALVKEKKLPKSIKMYEPAVERVIDGIKRVQGNRDRDFQEKQKLLHKLKRERKGARREIQRDTAFLARQQLKETILSDMERKRKVNKILSGLQTQESEHKKWKLKKH